MTNCSNWKRQIALATNVKYMWWLTDKEAVACTLLLDVNLFINILLKINMKDINKLSLEELVDIHDKIANRLIEEFNFFEILNCSKSWGNLLH